jgi:hypothetical protein
MEFQYTTPQNTGVIVEISKDGARTIEDNGIFKRTGHDKGQVAPLFMDTNKRYLRDEIFAKSTIKENYQKLIAEVYIISLFFPDIAHPMIIPIGPQGSGKTLLFRLIKLIVDPRDNVDALVQRLPRDEKDRRVNIHDNFLSLFDNETSLKSFEMDELCAWVTGCSFTVRALYTTDENKTYSGKRPIGINGINIPIVNPDALSRSFIIEMEKVQDGLLPESEMILGIKNKMPAILGHIFETLKKALGMYDQVREEVRLNHRLADFIVLGETISRALGNENNEFLKAWEKNVENQNKTVLENNTFANVLSGYVENNTDYKENGKLSHTPEELFKALKIYAASEGIDSKFLPKSSGWVTRKINTVSSDLFLAGLSIKYDRTGEKRLIEFAKVNKKTPHL